MNSVSFFTFSLERNFFPASLIDTFCMFMIGRVLFTELPFDFPVSILQLSFTAIFDILYATKLYYIVHPTIILQTSRRNELVHILL